MDREHGPAWRRLALRPAGLLLLSVLVLNAAAWVVDSSALRQEEDSWGYVFGLLGLGVSAGLAWPLVACVRRGVSPRRRRSRRGR